MAKDPRYATLRTIIALDDLLTQRFRNYYSFVFGAIALVGSGFAVIAKVRGPWRFLAIPLFSLGWMQIGFLGHDAGHNQVFSRTRHNQWFGQLCFTTLLGMSFRPWKIRHDKHHADTNELDSDPDLENKVMAFTENAALEKRGFARWIVQNQARLYPILGMMATIGFRIDAWRYVLRLGKSPYNESSTRYDSERRIELGLLTFCTVLWCVIPAKLFGFKRWYSILIPAQAIFGLHMASVFAPNHKGMPQYEKGQKPDSYLEAQVLTSRNVIAYGPFRRILQPIYDWMYGGLNYQIEHHLFQTMPRRNLAKARLITQAYCQQIGVPYAEESFFQSWRSILGELHRIGQLAKAA